MRGLLSEETQHTIRDLAHEYWVEAVKKEVFTGIASGKEIGHRIADHVDDETTTLLANHFATARESKMDGSPLPRSMGDIWIHEAGVYHPVNIKSGEAGKKGQPNMVSLRRLLTALAMGRIDSYYLLIIKLRISSIAELKQQPPLDVYFQDILDYLDLEFIHFDAGPGQIMLKEQRFYDAVDSGFIPPDRTLRQKVEFLYALFEDQVKSLITNREATLLVMKDFVDSFVRNPPKLDQSPLNLKELAGGEG